MASQQDHCNAPPHCSNGCGFFANPATLGFCSKCYRDNCAVEANNTTLPNNVASVDTPNNNAATTMSSIAVPKPEASTAETPVVGSRNTNRCGQCNKKVGLVKGFKCRCGGTFCGEHRYAEEHECQFDFKAAGRERIDKANPVIKGDKLNRC